MPPGFEVSEDAMVLELLGMGRRLTADMSLTDLDL
jgi:hypothetical protein